MLFPLSLVLVSLFNDEAVDCDLSPESPASMADEFPSSSSRFTAIEAGQYDIIPLAKAVSAAVNAKQAIGHGDIPCQSSIR